MIFNVVYNEDCISGMKKLEENCVDLLLTDMPYGVTNIKWDERLDFVEFWNEVNRVCKENSNIVLFSNGLFSIDLINSNRDNFRYKLIWEKNVPTGMSSAKYRPMKYYEEICVFKTNKNKKVNDIYYNPIMKERVGKGKACYNYDHYFSNSNHIQLNKVKKKYDPNLVQPSDVLKFNVVPNRKGKLHPTEKPIELLDYLIDTYCIKDGIVLDTCAGSGSTLLSAKNKGRKYIGYEIEKEYFDLINKRLE